jgi:acylphosphatase
MVMALRTVYLLVTGKVQGVFFRQSTRRTAQALGLCGYVRNLASGQVEALVQGESSAVQVLITYCSTGPERARVDRLDQEELSSDNLHQFLTLMGVDSIGEGFSLLPDR